MHAYTDHPLKFDINMVSSDSAPLPLPYLCVINPILTMINQKKILLKYKYCFVERMWCQQKQSPPRRQMDRQTDDGQSDPYVVINILLA